MSGIKLVFGGATVNAGTKWGDPAGIKELFSTLKANDITTIDTAQYYGESEKLLGENNAGSQFTIDTKSVGGFDKGNALKPEVLYKEAHASIDRLKMKKVDIFYIHSPDLTLEHESWLPTINKLHKEGVFERFGVSNFAPKTVEEIYDICASKGYVLPSVYQGNYSPVARRQDTELFPTLRKLKIAFYAYSPLAGGFLAKTKSQIEEGAGRFNKEALRGMYHSMYVKPSYLEALGEWERIANDEGTSKADLAYRWVSYHSPLKTEQGDALIVGASSFEQLEQTAQGLKKGPLKKETVEAIEKVWESVKADAPLDNYHDIISKW